MLRLLVLLVLLANGAYFAWSQGHLLPLGYAPVSQREPERVTQQIQAQAVRLLSADEARRIEAQAAGARPAECLQAGLFDERQTESLRQLLAGWPAGSWQIDAAVDPARWMIYMGRYADAETLSRKKSELRYLRVLYETLPNPSMEPGLSLGSFDSQESANQQLAELAKKGVRTARVVQERPEQRGQRLRLAAVDESLRPRLDELRPLLAGHPLRACG